MSALVVAIAAVFGYRSCGFGFNTVVVCMVGGVLASLFLLVNVDDVVAVAVPMVVLVFVAVAVVIAVFLVCRVVWCNG